MITRKRCGCIEGVVGCWLGKGFMSKS